jgi:guanosine-3',5'-bis(diphosphate) 3'-pyrophosphohydrolase
VMHDPAFARVYLEEKRLLLERLTDADQRLLALARMRARSADGAA